MGVRGRVPNPDIDKRERKYRYTQIPNEPCGKPAPELQHTHTKIGVLQWERWWATPMATMWGPFDADNLERLLLMLEMQWAGDEAKPPWAEIRQLEDRYGLNPSARARLGWQVEGIDIPSDKPERLGNQVGERAQPVAGGTSDPRRLKVVGGSA